MKRVGKYELLDLLGRGGCGEVWKARDTELGRVVALKLMQRTDAEDLARFKREAHVVAQLSHPNIAQLYEFSVEPPYLAMQYIEGGSISEAKEKIAALRDAARAVHFAHQRRILHRDLKPANIMVDSSGRASVLDFGLAREVKGDQTAMTISGDIVGTPSYMAPEQARGDVKKVDVRTDVYGLGATLYFLLTGRPPHTGATTYDVITKVIYEEPVPPGGDRDLDTICLKALEKEPGRRYAGAGDFADDLERFLRKEPIHARLASTFYRLKKRIQRQPVIWSLAALLVATILGGSGFGLAMLVKRMQDKDRAAADAARRLEAEGLLEAARRTLHRLEIMQREPKADPAEGDVAKEALDWLAKADSVYSDLAETRLERGRVFMLMNREGDALAEFTKAIETSPRLAGARLERAGLLSAGYEMLRHERSGPRDESPEMRRLEQAVEGDVAAVEAWSKDEKDIDNAKGILAFGKGQYGLAIDHLEKYLGRNPSDAQAWGRRGHALYHLERYEESIDALTRALHHRPRFASAFLTRGLSKMARGDAAGAIADYDETLKIHPRESLAYQNRGNARAAQKDYARALADYVEAVTLNPRVAAFHYSAGVARHALGDFAGAIADFDDALKIDPGFMSAYHNRGAARLARGDYAGAIADYSEAVRYDPRDFLAYKNRASARRALGDLAGAIADYGESVKIEPGLVEAYVDRGLARREAGDLGAARDDFDRAIKLNPRAADPYVSRGAVRKALGDAAGAMSDYDEALKLDPSNAMAHFNRGNLRLTQADTAGALADFDEAIKIDPRFADAYVNRGLARQGKRDLEGALSDFQKALEVAPEGWTFRKKVEALLQAARATRSDF